MVHTFPHSGVRLFCDETLDDLMVGGYKILQKKNAFRFGTDSVLLADFAAPKSADIVADLGAGSGVLSFLMAAHQPGVRFDAVELQEDIVLMMKRSVALNRLEDRISVYCADLREAHRLLGFGRHTLVVANPPYSPEGTALVSETQSKRLARHEGGCTIEDIVRSASKLLKNGGRLAAVYPAPRLFDLMCAMREHRLEPKRVRMIQNVASSAPKLALIDAVKGANSMLHFMPPLILNNDDGTPSAEWLRIYGYC